MKKSKYKVLAVLPLFVFASMSLQACSSSSAHASCDSLSVLADQLNTEMANGNYEMAFAVVRSIYFEIKDEPEVPADDYRGKNRKYQRYGELDSQWWGRYFWCSKCNVYNPDKHASN